MDKTIIQVKVSIPFITEYEPINEELLKKVNEIQEKKDEALLELSKIKSSFPSIIEKKYKESKAINQNIEMDDSTPTLLVESFEEEVEREFVDCVNLMKKTQEKLSPIIGKLERAKTVLSEEGAFESKENNAPDYSKWNCLVSMVSK